MSRLIRTALLAFAAFGGAPCAMAGTIGLHVASHHMPAKTYNNSNPGIYYRHEEGWTAGVYRNSLRKNSVYAGYTWKFGILDVTTAGVTGYFNKVQPLLVPSVSLFTYQGITPRIAYIPRVEKKIGSHVVHLMVEF
ncbi:MAG: hypothetical protein H7Y33_05975 [Cytophagales bacterium]|nr:hypothetical protein [Rhizobacter sp.]